MNRNPQTITHIEPHNQGQVGYEYMSWDTYKNIPPVFCQRDFVGRASAAKHLHKFEPWHAQVIIGVFTEDCTGDFEGAKISYKKGDMVIIDSNTRKHIWINNLYGVNTHPDFLHATKYYFGKNGIEDSQALYYAIDSSMAYESQNDKFYGILVRAHGYTPKTKKIKTASGLLSALNFAANMLYPDIFKTNAAGKNQNLVGQIGLLKPQIISLDEVIYKSHPGSWDAAMIAAALMAFRRWGNNTRLIEGLTNLNQKVRMAHPVDDNGKYDAISIIAREWDLDPKHTDKKFPFRHTSWSHLPVQKPYSLILTTGFALYYIDKWMHNKRMEPRMPRDLRKVCYEWKDQQGTHSVLEANFLA